MCPVTATTAVGGALLKAGAFAVGAAKTAVGLGSTAPVITGGGAFQGTTLAATGAAAGGSAGGAAAAGGGVAAGLKTAAALGSLGLAAYPLLDPPGSPRMPAALAGLKSPKARRQESQETARRRALAGRAALRSQANVGRKSLLGE